MNKTGGWTLIELVLTLSLVSITATALMMSVYKPLIWGFEFAEIMRIFQPFYLAAEEMRQDLIPSIKNIEFKMQDNQLTIDYTDNYTKTYQCDPKQAVLYKYENNQQGILLSDVHCAFGLTQEENGWLVEITLETSEKTSAIKRVFYVRQS